MIDTRGRDSNTSGADSAKIPFSSANIFAFSVSIPVSEASDICASITVCSCFSRRQESGLDIASASSTSSCVQSSTAKQGTWPSPFSAVDFRRENEVEVLVVYPAFKWTALQSHTIKSRHLFTPRFRRKCNQQLNVAHFRAGPLGVAVTQLQYGRIQHNTEAGREHYMGKG